MGECAGTEIDNNVKSTKGWYFDLKEANSVALTNGLTTTWVGEKVLAKTLIFNGVLFFTTFIPANDSTAANTCQANEGEGRYYEVNLLTGAPMYDLTGDTTLDPQGRGRWEFEALRDLRLHVERFGLRLEAIENFPPRFWDRYTDSGLRLM